jgi:hypothetical protein
MGRREFTTGVTMLVLCGLLVIGSVLGWRKLFADLPGEQTAANEPAAACRTKQIHAGQKIRSSQVRVSVFNGGSRDGLAETTMTALRKRGFRPGEIGNAPSDAKVRRVAIWSTEDDDAQARLVALQFGKHIKVTFADVDLGPGIDVIVGNNFHGLGKAKTFIKVRSPQDVCIPAKSAAGADTNAAG